MKKNILILAILGLIVVGVVSFFQKDNNETKSKIVIDTMNVLGDEDKKNFLEKKEGLDNLNKRLAVINAVVELNEQGQRELVFNKTYQPVKALEVDDRIIFMDILNKNIEGDTTAEKIMKEFPGIKKGDFKNTGKLKDDIDFQILLNNLLVRTGYEPQNSEHLEDLLDEWENS